MSSEILDILSHVNLATLAAIIVFILVVYSAIQPLFLKLYKAIIRRYKKEEKEENLEQTVKATSQKMKEYEQNRINDRAQSFKIQKDLTDAMKSLKEELSNLRSITEERYQQSLERENKRARAELKDKIAQSYRTYHASKSWTHMDMEALEDLIKEYEDAGGKNSFVHSVVQKEMYTWELVDQSAASSYYK